MNIDLPQILSCPFCGNKVALQVSYKDSLVYGEIFQISSPFICKKCKAKPKIIQRLEKEEIIKELINKIIKGITEIISNWNKHWKISED